MDFLYPIDRAAFAYFWKGSKASANALPTWDKIFWLPK